MTVPEIDIPNVSDLEIMSHLPEYIRGILERICGLEHRAGISGTLDAGGAGIT